MILHYLTIGAGYFVACLVACRLAFWIVDHSPHEPTEEDDVFPN